jgi:hypothetical protein
MVASGRGMAQAFNTATSMDMLPSSGHKNKVLQVYDYGRSVDAQH